MRGRRCSGWFLPLQPVDRAHHQKDDEREDDEIDRDGDEIAVREKRHAGLRQRLIVRRTRVRSRRLAEHNKPL